MRLAAILVLILLGESKIYFKEEFDSLLSPLNRILTICSMFTEDWQKRWVVSTSTPEWKRGRWVLDHPPKYYNKEKAMGLKTLDDNKYYQITADMGKTFSSAGKTLILSYNVFYPYRPRCSGAYIKLLPEVIHQENFSSTDPFYIMFGPDRCGHGNKFLPFIVQKKQKNHPIKKIINCTDEDGTHLYTLFMHFTNYTYEIFIDDERKYDGYLWEDFDFMEPPMVCLYWSFLC